MFLCGLTAAAPFPQLHCGYLVALPAKLSLCTQAGETPERLVCFPKKKLSNGPRNTADGQILLNVCGVRFIKGAFTLLT